MSNKNFIINLAKLIIPLFDLKQQLLTGDVNSNEIFSNDTNVTPAPLSRPSELIQDDLLFYQNPLLENSPEPGVVRLVDGSGWALVTSTNNAIKNSSAFPIYFSEGELGKTRPGHLESSSWLDWAPLR